MEDDTEDCTLLVIPLASINIRILYCQSVRVEDRQIVCEQDEASHRSLIADNDPVETDCRDEPTGESECPRVLKAHEPNNDRCSSPYQSTDESL